MLCVVLVEAVSLSVASVVKAKLAIIAVPFSEMVLMFLVMAIVAPMGSTG